MPAILHVIRAPRGGVLRHVDDLARAQAAMGHRVGLLCDGDTGNARDSARLDALQHDLPLGVTRISMGRAVGLSDLAAAIAVARAVGTIRPGVVHGHGAKGGAFGRVAAAIARRGGARSKGFYTPHGGSLHHDPASLAGRAYFTAERALERLTSGIVFVSGFEQAAYTAKIGAPRCPVRLVHNGLTSGEFEPVTLAGDASDILFLGEMRHLKGVDVLIEALAALNTRRIVTATLVGAGPDREAFRALIERRGLGGRVRLADPMPAREAFRLGRVMAVPSRAESLPYVVLEAVAAARPLVATRVGGIPEIVPAHSLVAPGDSGALAMAISAALDDPAAGEARATELANGLRKRFSVETMARDITDFYSLAQPADARVTP